MASGWGACNETHEPFSAQTCAYVNSMASMKMINNFALFSSAFAVFEICSFRIWSFQRTGVDFAHPQGCCRDQGQGAWEHFKSCKAPWELVSVMTESELPAPRPQPEQRRGLRLPGLQENQLGVWPLTGPLWAGVPACQAAAQRNACSIHMSSAPAGGGALTYKEGMNEPLPVPTPDFQEQNANLPAHH